MVFLCVLATSFQYLLLLLGPYNFCHLLCPSLHEMFPWSPISLKRSLVFPSLLVHLRKLSYFHVILWNSAFIWVYLFFSPLPFDSLLSSAIFKTSSDNHFAFLHFSLALFWPLPPILCYKPLSIVFQALCTRSNPLNMFVTSNV